MLRCYNHSIETGPSKRRNMRLGETIKSNIRVSVYKTML
ncbi:hypothetical protein F3D3_1045 [Fusibacter sp. 3D3]|nr:hypothetical protein F3D3_1045 [Fusibacter sp. 3D3]